MVIYSGPYIDVWPEVRVRLTWTDASSPATLSRRRDASDERSGFHIDNNVC